MRRSTLIALVCAVFFAGVISDGETDNRCCVDQPPPKIIVEKVGAQTRYRTTTGRTRHTTSCGFLWLSRCSKYTTYTYAQSYSVDLYSQRSVPQPCNKFACCKGYVMVRDFCYADHELSAVAGHIADIKDSMSDVGNLGLNDVVDAVHDVVG